MNFCPSCGKEIKEGMNNCPNCGASLQKEKETKSQTTNIGIKPEERNIVTAIILSLVTCGIYSIYWFCKLTDDANNACEANKTASGGMAILLTIVTCGIYQIYWSYKQGKKLEEAGSLRGIKVDDNSTLFLILSIFGLGLVNYCLMQDTLNKLAE